MKLTYELTKQDFIKNVKLNPVFTYLLCAFPVLVTIMSDFPKYLSLQVRLADVIAAFIPAIILLAFTNLLNKSTAKNRSELYAGKYEIEFSQDQIVTYHPYGTMTNTWFLYRKIKVNKDYILLYQKPAPLFTIIPKSAFSSSNEVDSFIAMASKRIESACQFKPTLPQ